MAIIVNVFWDIDQNQTNKDAVSSIFSSSFLFSSSFHSEVKSISKSTLQSIDIQIVTEECTTNDTNQDCQVFFGPGAVCRKNQCYCDHRRSFVHNNRCGNFLDIPIDERVPSV